MKTLPERTGVPIFGNFFVYQKDRLKFLDELSRELGDLAAFRMGSRQMVAISHPDDVAWVLLKNGKNYVKATNLTEVLGLGVLTSEGELWRRQRKIMNPMFHHGHIAGLAGLMNEKTREALDRFETPAREGKPIALSSAMTELACAIVGHALFGADLNPHFAELSATVKFLDQAVTRRLYRLLPVPLSIPLPSHVRYLNAIRSLDRIIYGLIDGKSPTSKNSKDLVTLLVQAKDEDTGESMDRKQVRDEAATLLLAGHETTGQTLAWTLSLIAERPEIQAKLAREVDEVLAGREPSLEDLGRLTYLGQVLDESMRIRPAVWAFIRKTVEDDEIRGFRIPANSIALILPYLTHRHPEFWPDPDRFDPDRFDPAKVEAAHKFAHYPFGAGPRQCMGKHFAMMEVKIVLAQMFQRFTVAGVVGKPVVPLPQVTMGIAGGLHVHLKRRAGAVERKP